MSYTNYTQYIQGKQAGLGEKNGCCNAFDEHKISNNGKCLFCGKKFEKASVE